MRLIFISISLFYSLFSFSQVIETPLISNPSLQPKAKLHGVSSLNLSSGGNRGTSFNCILPGDTLSINIDTIGYGADYTLEYLKNTNSGKTEIIDKKQLQYIAVDGVDFMLDTIVLRICRADSTFCNNLSYFFAVERASTRFDQNLFTTAEEIKTSFVMPLNQVPSKVVTLKISDNDPHIEAVGFIVSPDQFVFYSGRGGYQNTFNIKACDAYCVCDTFVYPVKVTADTINLPILDDFSYNGPYPDRKLWINDDVYVNNTFGINPPSIGVATFDGTDAGGTPYGGSYGFSDFLTSRQIDLSQLSVNDNVNLSFYLEPKGNGNNPEIVDTFFVEFKDQDGHWNNIFEFTSDFPFVQDSFTYWSFTIFQPKYFYKGFQFRFKNKSDNSGMLDNWHLDYISLNSGALPSLYTSDIAFTRQPNGILKNYTAMPWKQFENFEKEELNLDDNKLNLSIGLHNFFNKIETADPSNLKITESKSGKQLVNNTTLLELPPIVPEDQRNLDPGFHNFDSGKNLPNFMNDIVNDFNGGDAYEFVTEYSIDNSSEANFPAIKSNNKVSQKTVMSYYFAYDDGSAESNIAVKKTGSEAAVKFHANVGDTLRAIQIFIPRVFNDVSKQLFNLKVWTGDLNNEAVHTDYLVKPFYLDKLFDTLQGYTTYVLMDETVSKPEPVYIPAGDFFVGWQQATDDEFPITVGFDKNNLAAADNSFVNLSAGWQKLSSLNFNGAIMIRPVLGDVMLNNSPDLVKTQVINASNISIGPNPTKDKLQILISDTKTKVSESSISNLQGILLKKFSDENILDISDLPNGMYFIRLKSDQNTYVTQKFIISR